MTETVKDRFNKVLEDAKDRSKKTRNILRRNRLAYVGLYGLAYDKAQERMAEFRTTRENLFSGFVQKGEDMEARVSEYFNGAKDKVEEARENISEKTWTFTPGSKINRVEALEAELDAAKAKFAKLNKKAKKSSKKAVKKATKTAAKVTSNTVENVVKTVSPVKTTAKKVTVETAKSDIEARTPSTPKAKATTTTKPKTSEPRHIPYFNDVKRYDPLANEDIVRKIVNHCGIALQSADARYVACSDEAERNRVRDSWLKKKLGLTASDADLDKKVQNICAVMQRDNLKNRVTFYYLIAKAERKLGDL